MALLREEAKSHILQETGIPQSAAPEAASIMLQGKADVIRANLKPRGNMRKAVILPTEVLHVKKLAATYWNDKDGKGTRDHLVQLLAMKGDMV